MDEATQSLQETPAPNHAQRQSMNRAARPSSVRPGPVRSNPTPERIIYESFETPYNWFGSCRLERGALSKASRQPLEHQGIG